MTSHSKIKRKKYDLKYIESEKGFFNDFKNISSKSFNIYWEKIKDIDSQIDNKKITKEQIEEDNIPKFISEFEKKNKE